MIEEIRGLPGVTHEHLSAELNGLYAGCCDDHSHLKLKGEISDDELSQYLTQMIERVWRRKGMPKTIDKNVTRYYAQRIWKEVESGFGNGFAGIAYDSPDYNMLADLQKNVYHFSSAKNYQQLKALTEALVDENGKMRTKQAFRREAAKINDLHIGPWLDVEADTALGSAQMASRWVDIVANEDILPILEFDAVMDQRTSQICSSLNGVRKRVDDPFWGKYYPPIHFICRSSVRQRSGGAVTPDGDIVYPDKVNPMFLVNLAEQGLIFPPGHPYWEGVPENVLNAGLNLIPEN